MAHYRVLEERLADFDIANRVEMLNGMALKNCFVVMAELGMTEIDKFDIISTGTELQMMFELDYQVEDAREIIQLAFSNQLEVDANEILLTGATAYDDLTSTLRLLLEYGQSLPFHQSLTLLKPFQFS